MKKFPNLISYAYKIDTFINSNMMQVALPSI